MHREQVQRTAAAPCNEDDGDGEAGVGEGALGD